MKVDFPCYFPLGLLFFFQRADESEIRMIEQDEIPKQLYDVLPEPVRKNPDATFLRKSNVV